jgi:hypothetical protein
VEPRKEEEEEEEEGGGIKRGDRENYITGSFIMGTVHLT